MSSQFFPKENSQNVDDVQSSSINDSADTFVIYIWPGEWNLPSLDPQCLTALCYLKFANLKHKVVIVDKAFQLFKNDYPRLEYKNKEYVGLEEIINFLKNEKNIDVSLNDNNYANMLAYLNLFKEKFLPAFNWLCWLDEDNTYTVIRRSYGKYIRFPLSIFKLRSMSKSVENLILSGYKDSYVKLHELKPVILDEGKECLNILSHILSENTFMFENQPSTLDAYIYGYLSVLHKASFNSPLKTHLIACSNLCSLINRIQRDAFPIDLKELEKNLNNKRDQLNLKKKNFWYSFLSSNSNSSGQTTSTTTTTTTTFEENEEREKRKNQIIAVGIALTAMITYAFAVGIIKIDIIRTDLEYREKI